MCMVEYADGCTEFYRSTKPVARKPHRCDECGRTISVGETHIYATGKSDGYFWAVRMCAHCEVAAEWLRQNCGGFLYGQVWEDIEEHVAEYPDLALGLQRLTDGAHRKWARPDGSGLMGIPTVPEGIKEFVAAWPCK